MQEKEGDKETYLIINRIVLNELFQKHFPALKAYACLFVDSDTAADIIQDVFVYVWENREVLKIHTSVTSYLFRAVYTRCLNNINHEKNVQNSHQFIANTIKSAEIEYFDPDKNEIIRRLYMDELREEIDNAINSLPPKCKEVFTLSYIMDMKNSEIGEMVGISVSTVEKHINSALKQLRNILKDLRLGSLFFTL